MKKILVAFSILALGTFIFTSMPAAKASTTKASQTTVVYSSDDISDFGAPGFDGDKKKSKKKSSSSSCKPSDCKTSGSGCSSKPTSEAKPCSSTSGSSSSAVQTSNAPASSGCAPAKSCCAGKN